MNEQAQTHDATDAEMEAAPLTDWATAPTLEDLKQDYTEASTSRENHSGAVSSWLDNLHVTGAARPKKQDGRSNFVPKLIRKQAEWRYAALSEPFLSTRDIFKAAPVSWEDTKRALQDQLVLNNQFNTKIKKRKLIDDYVRTAVDEGTVIAKVCWDFEEEKYTVQEPVMEFYVNPALTQVHEEIAQLKATNPAGYETDIPFELKRAHELTLETGTPIEARLTGQMESVTKTRIVRNRPDIEICDYRCVTIDPTARGDMEKCRFVIHSFQSSLDELKRDGRYKNLDRIKSSDTDVLSAPDHHDDGAEAFKFNDKARKQFTVHEYWGYWDIDGKGLVTPIVAAWVDGTLIRMEKNPYPHQKLPFVVVQYLPARFSNFGEPDGHLLSDNQALAGAVTRGMIDLMARSANGQMGMQKGALDATNRRKFERGQDYEYNPNVNPQQGMYMHAYPEIPASAQFMLQLQNMDAESLTGVKAFSGGLSGEALGDVATAVRGVMDAASKREAGILRRLAEGIVDIGRMVLSMNAEFLDEDEVVRITNEPYIPPREDDFAAVSDLYLTISTAEEDAARAQELAFMLQTAAQSMDTKMRNRLLSEIARLRKMPELAKELLEYEPQPDPLQEQIQLLEIEKLKKEIAKLDTAANKDLTAANLDQAKARELGSSADLKDLDFVEQESGVTQERELQKQGAQAQANIVLEERKADLKVKSDRLTNLHKYLGKKSSEK